MADAGKDVRVIGAVLLSQSTDTLTRDPDETPDLILWDLGSRASR